LGCFYNAHKITLPTQPLIFDKKLFKGYKPEVALFAERAVQDLNQQIASLPHLSMVVGRKISIATNTHDEFFKAIVNDPFFSSKKIWYQEFKKIEKEGLNALQEQGYIFSYKAPQYEQCFSVVC
jgi:hypothetical protein